MGIITKRVERLDNTDNVNEITIFFAKRILQAALVAIARLPFLILASRFYIEFIINANTISVISYTYAHISGESLCTSRYIQLFTIPRSETRLERNPRKIIFSLGSPKIISNATISIGSWFFFFPVYTFTSLCNCNRRTVSSHAGRSGSTKLASRTEPSHVCKV